jgi:hypothetical protein
MTIFSFCFAPISDPVGALLFLMDLAAPHKPPGIVASAASVSAVAPDGSAAPRTSRLGEPRAAVQRCRPADKRAPTLVLSNSEAARATSVSGIASKAQRS